uniref:Uncharacterized protein LOC116947353 n=1 Tax=Petromyzon marinus TaxID=7757 RepID=A0AAJ7TLQ3_PETMA|nr:uncharacterized protein LOC116947353 [Petromyzon marinus]
MEASCEFLDIREDAFQTACPLAPTRRENQPNQRVGVRRARKNEREKLRMRKLTRALRALQGILPPHLAAVGRPLSKIQTLRLTIRYIAQLSRLLQHGTGEAAGSQEVKDGLAQSCSEPPSLLHDRSPGSSWKWEEDVVHPAVGTLGQWHASQTLLASQPLPLAKWVSHGAAAEEERGVVCKQEPSWNSCSHVYCDPDPRWASDSEETWSHSSPNKSESPLEQYSPRYVKGWEGTTMQPFSMLHA